MYNRNIPFAFDGDVRAQLDVESNGEVMFRLRDAQGTIRLKMGASEDGPGLLLINDLTKPGVQILADRNGTSLTLTEAGGAKRVIEL